MTTTFTDLTTGIVSDSTTFSSRVWRTVLKTVDESLTSNATLQNDDELTFAIPNTARVALRGHLFYLTHTTPDFQYQIYGSATPTFYIMEHRAIVPIAAAYSSVEVSTTIATPYTLTTGGTGPGMVAFDGIIYNNTGSAIQITVQWAQVVSNANTTTVYAGSYLEYRFMS